MTVKTWVAVNKSTSYSWRWRRQRKEGKQRAGWRHKTCCKV